METCNGDRRTFKPESQEEVLHDLSERPMVAIGG